MYGPCVPAETIEPDSVLNFFVGTDVETIDVLHALFGPYSQDSIDTSTAEYPYNFWIDNFTLIKFKYIERQEVRGITADAWKINEIVWGNYTFDVTAYFYPQVENEGSHRFLTSSYNYFLCRGGKLWAVILVPWILYRSE